MAFDQILAARIRELNQRTWSLTEKKMFGGLCFMLAGNMCVGIWKESLIVRVGPDSYQSSLSKPFVDEFDVTGRSMRGWVLVGPHGIDSQAQLRQWIESAIEFVGTLPEK